MLIFRSLKNIQRYYFYIFTIFYVFPTEISTYFPCKTMLVNGQSNRTVQDLLTIIKFRKLVCTLELRLLQLK
jgi:hypothetical protein